MTEASGVRQGWKQSHRALIGRVARDLLDAGSIAAAADLFGLLVEVDPEDLSNRRRETEALIILHRFAEAEHQSRALIAMQPIPSERDIITLSDAMMFQDRRKDAAGVVTAHAARLAAHLTATGAARGPLVVVAALPKSGSTSLTQGLAACLGLQQVEFLNLRGARSFASRDPVLRGYPLLAGFGLAVHSHLEPQMPAVAVLQAKERARIFLHVRDPREALLSTIAMAHRIRPPNILLACPDFLDLPRGPQIDWMIDRYLPDQVAWITGWLSLVRERPDLVVGVSTHYDMVAEGHDRLSQRLAQAAGLAPLQDVTSTARRFVSGESGHWRREMTPGQIARAEAVMGPDLLAWLEDRRRAAGL